MIKYSIIICSYNRFKLLSETIESVIEVLKNREDYEVLIIDNNSPDETSSLKDIYSNNKKVKYVLESRQGLSHARNRGIDESEGKILIFLDDDVELEPNYFQICDEIFSDDLVSIVGGKVLPYKVDIPSWLPNKYYFLVSVFDLGNKSKDVDTLMGANYSMRKSLALEVGYYNVDLGRKGDNLMGGEENDYFNRVLKLNYKILYNPKLVVFHKINDKLNENYVLTYSRDIGKSLRIIDTSLSKYNILKKTTKSYIALFFCKIFLLLTRNEKMKIYLKIVNQYAYGYLNK